MNNRGSFFSEMRLRNLVLPKELRMFSNLSRTSSIVGRFSGLSSVIASTKSCINSKPLHFCNILSVSQGGEGKLGYHHELLADEIAKVIDIGRKWIATNSTPVLRGSSIAAT